MRLLVAVSGGRDSMCLVEKVRLEGGPFAIAHCNFALRGDESDADEAFVRAWAGSHGIPLHVKRFDTRGYAAENGISIEMAARRLRYRWFGELCREYGYGGVAVAHHAQDNAETLILNLLRGTGLKGITGMKAEGFLPDPDYADIPLLRPLLSLTREEIDAFVRENGIPYREDRTNAENDCKRNKIRNLVFPVFRDINPSFVRTLNRDMERFREELSGEAPETGPTEPEEAGPTEPVAYTVTEEAWDGTGPLKQPEGQLILDADKVLEPRFGPWESGDWIRPLGMRGRKKLQDWFKDRHYSLIDKQKAVIVRDSGLADAPATGRILRIVIS
mgnify:CR=1 FL=1